MRAGAAANELAWQPGRLPRLAGHGDDCFREQQELRGKRSVLEVVEIVGELPGSARLRAAVPASDLRPAGDSRLHQVAALVMGELALQSRDELRALGAGADYRH